MKKQLIVLGLGVAAMLAGCGDDEEDVSAILALTGDATNGEAVYGMSCGVSSCHGTKAMPGPAVVLATAASGLDDEALATVIKFGTGTMPGSTDSDQEIADVMAFVRSEFP